MLSNLLIEAFKVRRPLVASLRGPLSDSFKILLNATISLSLHKELEKVAIQC